VFKRNVVCALLLLLPAFALAAEPNEPGNPAIRAAVEKFIDAQDISGAVTVVAAKDKLLAVDTIGLADIAKKKPMEPDSLFWIASMTKPLTAVSILMLQDEGKLKVSDPVEKFIPEFAALKTPTGRPAQITIEQILTHTSGLGEGGSGAIKSAHTLRDLIPIYLASPMQYEPGARWKYTQSGINVAARIVEVTSGLPFDEFVNKHILKPLGMKHTTFYPNKKQRSHLATPYIKDKETGILTAAPYAAYGIKGQPPFGNAGLFSTGPDYARFCQMLLNGGTLKGKRYLSPAAFVDKHVLLSKWQQVFACADERRTRLQPKQGLYKLREKSLHEGHGFSRAADGPGREGFRVCVRTTITKSSPGGTAELQTCPN